MKRAKVSYGGSGVSEFHKEHIAQIAYGLKQDGYPISRFLEILSTTSYAPAEKTLRTHVGSLRSGKDLFSTSKASGRPSVLTDEEWSILCGWILLKDSKVNYDMAIKWVEEFLGPKVSVQTMSQNLRRLQMRIHLVGKRERKSTTQRDYDQGYLKFLQEVRECDFFNYPHAKILHFDSATNSYRLDRETTLSLVGEGQKKYKGEKAKYTNNYLVPAAMAEGLGLTPMMFTFDPVFNPKGKHWNKVLGWCTEMFHRGTPS
jgi:hypothetical protein